MELDKLAKHIKKCLETEEYFEYYLEKTIKLCEYTENNNESLKKEKDDDYMQNNILSLLKSGKTLEQWINSKDNNLFPMYVVIKPVKVRKYYYDFLNEIERDFESLEKGYRNLKKDFFNLFLEYLFNKKVIKYKYNEEFFRENLGKIIFFNRFIGHRVLEINLLVLRPILKTLCKNNPKLLNLIKDNPEILI